MRYGKYFDTAIGRLYLEVEGGRLVRLTGRTEDKTAQACRREDKRTKAKPAEEPDEACLRLAERVEREVSEYLAGKRREFDIPLHTKGTPFQERVWEALRGIPYGETRSYGEIAVAAGSPKGARAVGMACNRNPVLILTPCHRVVGSTGKLVGFAGGLEAKKHLLELEGADKGEKKESGGKAEKCIGQA